MVKRCGLLEEESCDALASVQAEAIQKALPWAQPSEEDPKKLAAFLEGFSLQAGTHVHERVRVTDLISAARAKRPLIFP